MIAFRDTAEGHQHTEATQVQVVAHQSMSMLKAICNSNRGAHFTTKEIISIISHSIRFTLIIIILLRDTARDEDVVGAAAEEPRP